MADVFVADVHAGARTPRASEAFLTFLQEVASRAETLYLLGDVFDAWLGDDDLRAPHDAIVEALASVTRAGTHVGIMHGNHDFLLGSQFAEMTGCALMPEIQEIALGGRRVVVCHGDELCTDDAEYQAFRAYSRSPDNQRAFLALSLAERAEQALQLAAASRQAVAHKAHEIMDVNENAVGELISKHDADWLIHGHTHRPKDHVHHVAGRDRHRFVLGDWYEQESVLVFARDTLHRVTANDLPALLN